MNGRGTGIVRILRPGLSTLMTCGLAFNACVNAVEDGVVVDLHGEQQAGRGNLQRAAGQRHGNVVGRVKRDDEAEFAAERVEEGVPFDLGFLFKLGGEFVQPLLRLGQVGLGDFLLRDGPEHRQVRVRENGQRRVGGQEVQAGERMRFLAGELPEEAGRLCRDNDATAPCCGTCLSRFPPNSCPRR